jgi:hypothetical protein
MRQFVPMTDEMLNRLDSLPGPLVPYHCGIPCLHVLRDAGAATANGSEHLSAGNGERVARLHADLLGGAGV